MSKAYSKEAGTGTFKWDGVMSYPGLYSPRDFNGKGECNTENLNIKDYGNKYEVRNCRLEGLADLNQGSVDVRFAIQNYMNRLIDKGVAGFRIDAAKHMWPDHLHAIYENLKNLNQDYFPGSPRRPFIFQEVIDNGKREEAISAFEYTGFARVTNFIFGTELAQVFLRNNLAKWLVNWGTEWNMPQSEDVVVFIDNHDNQRGHGGGGWLTLKLILFLKKNSHASYEVNLDDVRVLVAGFLCFCHSRIIPLPSQLPHLHTHDKNDFTM